MLDSMINEIRSELESVYAGKRLHANMTNEICDYIWGLLKRKGLLDAYLDSFPKPQISQSGGVISINWEGTKTLNEIDL